jgi:hypothetical protein
MSMPSAFAVLRLSTSSNLVACRLFAPEHPRRIAAGQLLDLVGVRAIAGEAAGLGMVANVEDRRQAPRERELGDMRAIDEKRNPSGSPPRN